MRHCFIEGYLPYDRGRDSFSRDVVYFKKYGTYSIIENFAGRIISGFSNVDCDIIIPIPSSRANVILDANRILVSKLSNAFGIEDGSNILTRTNSVNSSHGSSGDSRTTEEEHYETIACSHNLEGKNILLYDDVYTLGRVSRACSRKLFESNVSDITLLTLGKTIN